MNLALHQFLQFYAVLLIKSKKAFDCVHHKILTGNLKNKNFGGKVFSLIESYVSLRQQYVKVKQKNLKNVWFFVVFSRALNWFHYLLSLNDLPETVKEELYYGSGDL